MKKLSEKKKTLQRKTNFKPTKKKLTKKPSELQRNKSHLIYGRNGTGKTTLASTYPKPIILIDFKDEGTESITDEDVDEVFEAGSILETEDAYWYCEALAKQGKLGTVILDTTTAMQRIFVEEVAAESKNAKKGKKAGEWGSMTQKDWGKVSGQMNSWITRFADLPCETVFIAQEKVFDPSESDDGVEDELMPEVGPANMKSVASHICSKCSFIGHTFIRSVEYKHKMKRRRRPEYCIRVGPNSVYITKVRKPRHIKLPDFVSDPNYQSLMDLRTGNGKEVEERTSRREEKEKRHPHRRALRRAG